MYKRLPPLNSLKSFESAARHLSFTKAADELFVTQAAVSHQIKLLEDFLGVELFIRKNRSLELTEFGKAYIAIYYGKGDWENLQVDRLGEENLVILAAPALLEKIPVRRPDDLKKHTLIHTHTRDNWQAMADYLKLDDLNIQQGPLFSHTFMALQAAVHGQGIVLANRILAQQEIENGHLQIVLPTELRDPKSFYVVNHLDRLDDEQIQAFRTWIKDSIKLGKHE